MILTSSRVSISSRSLSPDFPTTGTRTRVEYDLKTRRPSRISPTALDTAPGVELVSRRAFNH